SALPAAGRGRQSHDAPENRPNAWGPSGREGDAQRQRSQNAAWLLAAELPRVAIEPLDLNQSNQVQTEDNDYDPANNSHPRVTDDRRSNQPGRRAQRDKDHRQSNI